MKVVDILGLGESIEEYIPQKSHTTIGVNEAGHYHQCDYVVLLNSKAEFEGARWAKIEQPKTLPLTPIILTHKKAIHQQLSGTPYGLNVINITPLLTKMHKVKANASFKDGCIYHSQTSPFVAVMYAVQILQATEINLYGVDFNTHRAIRTNTGRQANEFKCWRWLFKECIKHDINVTVSGRSRLVDIINELI